MAQKQREAIGGQCGQRGKQSRVAMHSLSHYHHRSSHACPCPPHHPLFPPTHLNPHKPAPAPPTHPPISILACLHLPHPPLPAISHMPAPSKPFLTCLFFPPCPPPPLFNTYTPFSPSKTHPGLPLHKAPKPYCCPYTKPLKPIAAPTQSP